MHRQWSAVVQVRPEAGYLMVPSIIWVTFANVLNKKLKDLNPDHNRLTEDNLRQHPTPGQPRQSPITLHVLPNSIVQTT
jgi:hypothetical protein